jgi:hypothetical protein
MPYFQESFPGVQERLERHRRALRSAEIVGPLVTRQVRGRSPHADAVLVNFGGLSGSLLEPATLVTYADAMAQCAAAAMTGWQGRVVVSAGRHILDRMDLRTLRTIRRSVEVVDLGHDAYLAELRRSRALIYFGRHARALRGVLAGRALPCLPSQNLSGLLALEVLARHGPAGARIAAEIQRFSHDRAGQRWLVRQLRSAFDDRRLQALQRRQARFYAGLGERGAPAVAARVLELVGDRSGAALLQGA